MYSNCNTIFFLVCSDLSPIPELEPEFRGDGRTTYEGKSIADLAALVENCRSKGPTVHTVMACTQLAEQFSDLAHEVSRSCENLVHEQHLQHQVRHEKAKNINSFMFSLS